MSRRIVQLSLRQSLGTLLLFIGIIVPPIRAEGPQEAQVPSEEQVARELEESGFVKDLVAALIDPTSSDGTGYTASFRFSSARKSIFTRQVTRSNESSKDVSVGPFKFDDFEVGRWNFHFEDHRFADLPAPFDSYRMSFYSEMKDGGMVNVQFLTEKFVDGDWQRAGMATATFPYGTRQISLSVVPLSHDFEVDLNLNVVELSIDLTYKGAASKAD